MKLIGYALLALALVLAGYAGLLWRGYIDELVTEGEAYGLVIGESKRRSYERVGKVLSLLEEKNGRAFTQVEVGEELAQVLGVAPGRIVMVEAVIDEFGYSLYSSRDTWQFYFGGSYFNSLSLIFCEDRLCEMHRHRKQFELP